MCAGMNVSRSLVSLALTISVLGGCTRSPDVTAPTVEYYRGNAAEREAQVQKCKSDPGALSKTAACVNALQAAELESVGSLRDLPSMGLSPQKGEDPQSSTTAQ